MAEGNWAQITPMRCLTPVSKVLFILMCAYTGVVCGQNFLCCTDSDCDYPGCNEEGGREYPFLCQGTPKHCQHEDDWGLPHACAPPPPGWVATAPPPPPASGCVAPGSEPEVCLCPAMDSGMTCTSTVRQVADFPAFQDSLRACSAFLVNTDTVAESDKLSLHCPDECRATSPSVESMKTSGMDDELSPLAVLITATSSVAALW